MSRSCFVSPSLLCVVLPLLTPSVRAQEQPPQIPPANPSEQPPSSSGPPPANLDAPRTVPRTTPTPPPIPASQQNMLDVEHTESVSGGQDGEPLVLSGNVRLRYNNYRVVCDRATYDSKRRLVTFEGKVKADTGTQTIYADYLEVNTRTQEFIAREGRTIIPAELIGPDIIEPVLLQGKTLERKGNIITALDGVMTTCDFPNPHYKIGFRQADFIPNDRIVLRDSTIYRYEKKMARVRYLVVPVRERSTVSIPPNVGRTDEEGYFVKFGLGYALNAILPGLLRVDLMEKKGIGLGFDQAYRIAQQASGTFALYNLNDRNRGVHNLNGRLNHQQYLGDALATVTSDFQNNSYQSLTPQSKTANTTATVTRNIGPHDTNLSVTRSNSDYSTNKSGTTTYTLTQTERFGLSNSVTLRLNGSDTTTETLGLTSASTGRTEQTGDLQANLKFGIFDTTLKANKSLQLRQKGNSGGSVAFSGTQRLPDLALTTDTERFARSGSLSGFLRRIPGSYTLGYGRFLENISSFSGTETTTRAVTTGRFLFGFAPRDKRIPLTPGGNLSLQLGGNFQQTVYREDAAQYVLTGRSNLVQKLGQSSSFNITYNYLRPYGGAPSEFRLDQTGSSNNLNSSLTVETYRTRLSLVTGYDIFEARSDSQAGITKTPWQNVALQVGLRASPVLQTRFTTTYDINSGRLLDVTDNTRIRGRGNFALDTGIRFDPRRYRFPLITEVLTLPLFSRDLTLSALSSYNGVTYRFDYKQFYLTKSFHDYELLISYVDQPYGFRSQRGFNFAIRLKAFPSLRPSTTGQFGTPLDTGVGSSF